MTDFEIPKEQIERYIQNRVKDLAAMRENIRDKDFTQIARKAHNIKGNAETFGFPELGTLGAQLEEDALNQKQDQVEMHITEFAKWVQQNAPQN